MKEIALRIAHSDELQKLVAIDDEASELYAKAGLKLEIEKDHPFVGAEKFTWASAIEQGLAHVAVTPQDTPPGNRLHPLSGNRQGQHAISINDQ